MPRVGSDRVQIGLGPMGSDRTDLEWIDLAQMEIRLDAMGSDQIGADRLRFPLDSRYLRVRHVRYPHPSDHGHRTPEKAKKRWRIVSDGHMVGLQTRRRIFSKGQIRVGHDGGTIRPSMSMVLAFGAGLRSDEVKHGQPFKEQNGLLSCPLRLRHTHGIVHCRHKVALRATISYWLRSLCSRRRASAWYLGQLRVAAPKQLLVAALSRT